MKAEIIAVGSELLTPDRLDTNSLFLTEQLNRLGFEIVRNTVVGDLLSQVHDAFRGALDRVELVVSIGGLGPTEDDLTRETVAEMLGRKLIRNDAIIHEIEARFRKFGRRVMYALQDLEAWSNARTCESTSDPAYMALRHSV